MFIADTVKSIINNTLIINGLARLQYILCDGGSSDRTVDIVKAIFDEYSLPNVTYTIISEPDKGMYEALAKGLRKVTGDYCSYLNAGDLYFPEAFALVSVALSLPDVNWVTGIRTIYDEDGNVISKRLPYRFRSSHIQRGLYGKLGPFIQQESTFWKSDLIKTIDLDRMATLKLAGDYYMWVSFSRIVPLYIIDGLIGGFRRHAGQLSLNKKQYFYEVGLLCKKPGILDYLALALDTIIWKFCPDRFKPVLNRDIITYDPSEGPYIR